MSFTAVPVTAYILHWNRPWECLQAVEAFLAQDLPTQITVIDNGSKPELVRILSDGLPPHVDLVRLKENRGWGGGFNVLLAKWLRTKEGQYCFVSAHDALPQTKCLSKVLESMVGDSNKIGIACAEYGVSQMAKYSPILGPRLRGEEGGRVPFSFRGRRGRIRAWVECGEWMWARWCTTL